jgi:hypothetical protein
MRGTAPAQVPGAGSRSATASAVGSPPPAPSSCRTRRDRRRPPVYCERCWRRVHIFCPVHESLTMLTNRNVLFATHFGVGLITREAARIDMTGPGLRWIPIPAVTRSKLSRPEDVISRLYLDYSIITSTRLFCGSRTPGPVGTRGNLSPLPWTSITSSGIPRRINASLTLSAVIVENSTE